MMIAVQEIVWVAVLFQLVASSMAEDYPSAIPAELVQADQSGTSQILLWSVDFWASISGGSEMKSFSMPAFGKYLVVTEMGVYSSLMNFTWTDFQDSENYYYGFVTTGVENACYGSSQEPSEGFQFMEITYRGSGYNRNCVFFSNSTDFNEEFYQIMNEYQVSGGSKPLYDISGTWGYQGVYDLTITQHGNKLTATWANGSWETATGSYQSGDQVVMSFDDGNTVKGKVTESGDKIEWDNGTSWTRHQEPPPSAGEIFHSEGFEFYFSPSSGVKCNNVAISGFCLVISAAFAGLVASNLV